MVLIGAAWSGLLFLPDRAAIPDILALALWFAAVGIPLVACYLAGWYTPHASLAVAVRNL